MKGVVPQLEKTECFNQITLSFHLVICPHMRIRQLKLHTILPTVFQIITKSKTIRRLQMDGLYL